MSLTNQEMDDLLAAVGEVVSEQMSGLRGEVQAEMTRWTTEASSVLRVMQDAIETLNDSDHKLAERLDTIIASMNDQWRADHANGVDAKEVVRVLAEGLGLSVTRKKQ